jgi:hypothetical protein
MAYRTGTPYNHAESNESRANQIERALDVACV